MTESFYAGSAMGEDFARNPVIAVQRSQFARFASTSGPRRVLDLGCGAGSPAAALLPADGNTFAVGVDLSERALRSYAGRTGSPVARVDAQRLPFAAASFDIVISDDVIEHLVDTDAYADEVRRVLEPGGLLFLSTPNLAAWFNRGALLFGYQPAFTEVSFRKVFGRPGADIVGHLRLFTRRATTQFLEFHGFEILDVRGASFDALPRRIAALDRFIARWPSLAGNTAVVARRR